MASGTAASLLDKSHPSSGREIPMVKLTINSHRLQNVLITEAVIVTQRGGVTTEKCSCDTPGTLSSQLKE